MSYVIHHTKSDIKRFVCIFVIVDRLTKRLPGFVFLFYSLYCHELLWLIGFFVTFFYINNPAFFKTNSLGKTLDTRQKIFYATLPALCVYIWTQPSGSTINLNRLPGTQLCALDHSPSSSTRATVYVGRVSTP